MYALEERPKSRPLWRRLVRMQSRSVVPEELPRDRYMVLHPCEPIERRRLLKDTIGASKARVEIVAEEAATKRGLARAALIDLG